jgi:hypothetical protein
MRQLFYSSLLGGGRLLLFGAVLVWGKGATGARKWQGRSAGGCDAGARAALDGAPRQGKGGTAGMAASWGARARAPGRGRTGGERRCPGVGQGGAAGARRAEAWRNAASWRRTRASRRGTGGGLGDGGGSAGMRGG